jgi:RNA polymerase sigma-70 factor, ECF subfamily
MQATEAYIGSEQRLDVRIHEKETREMQNVLSRCLPSLYKKAYRHLGNAADAEDAVQDALLCAYKHLDQFKGQAQMSTWLTAIVINSARMQFRRRPSQMHVSLDEQCGEEQDYSLSQRLAGCGPSPEDECRNSELRGRLMQFVAELSPPLRKAFQLRDLDGLTASEAAHILGVADGTVKAQLSRARTKLRQLMRRALDAQPRSALTCTALPVDAQVSQGHRTCVTSTARLRDGQIPGSLAAGSEGVA